MFVSLIKKYFPFLVFFAILNLPSEKEISKEPFANKILPSVKSVCQMF
jgi:hypothetical protein